MGSYTGVVKAIPLREIGEAFPMQNPLNHYGVVAANYRNRRVYTAQLTDVAVIGTDDHTFTLFVADRALIVDACFIVDPEGLSVDATNYNTMQLYNSTTKLCEATTAYGVVANEPMELTRANTVANRTLAAADTVTLKITGTVLGRPINALLVFVVCSFG